MKKILIFAILISTSAFSESTTPTKDPKVNSDDLMKTCLAGDFGIFSYCQKNPAGCNKKEKNFINNNCPKDIQLDHHRLSDSTDILIVAKSNELNSIWVMDTKTKTMIKIQ